MSHDDAAPLTQVDIARLVERATRRGITLSPRTAERLKPLGRFRATRKVDDVCRIVRAARADAVELTFSAALRRLNACDGDVEMTIRRTLYGGLETRDGMPEAIRHAEDRGVHLAPRSVYDLITERGMAGALAYIAKLGRIMDDAASLGLECSQMAASLRLARAGSDVEQVLRDLRAERYRRDDREAGPCGVRIPPRDLTRRANAFADCGCRMCVSRLTAQLQGYVRAMISAPFFSDLDREEAMAEANLELIRSVAAWHGGVTFTGWFAARFATRVKEIYRARKREERDMLSLDADAMLADDQDGSVVPLGERIPDRTVDVVDIVLLRERVAEVERKQRLGRTNRAQEYRRAA